MYTSISNIIDLLIQVIEVNKNYINALIKEYEPGREIHVYKGMRKTLPRDAFPSLELEPTSGSTQWQTTETQNAEFSVQFTLTIMTDREDMSVEYIGNLTRVFTELFNNPSNMALPIPYEKGWVPSQQIKAQNNIQFGMCNNVSFNSNKEGTIRVATWDWTGQVRESFPREFYNIDTVKSLELEPHELPSVQEWNETV